MPGPTTSTIIATNSPEECATFSEQSLRRHCRPCAPRTRCYRPLPAQSPCIRIAGGDPPSQCPELALLPAPGECARHRRPMRPQGRCDLLMRHSHLTHRFGRLQAIPSHPRPTPANTPLSSSMRKPLRVFSRIVDIRSWANMAMIPIVASPIGVDASTSRNGSVNERSRNPRLPRSRITSIAILFEPANRSNARTTRTTPSRRYSTRSRQARSQCSERARTCTGPANRSNQPRW